MKILTKITIGLATSALLFVGCANTQESAGGKNSVEPTITEANLGYRGTNDLLKEDVVPPAVKYGKAAPGTSKLIKRAFQDAPPMIPHDTEGMLPITQSNNQCIQCHMPDVAKSMGATPIPVSHMTNFRPKSYAVSGKNTSSASLAHISIKKGSKLIGARFNCSQCHAPQSDTPLAVENNFEAVYTSKDGASKSSWNGAKLMEGIDTTK